MALTSPSSPLSEQREGATNRLAKSPVLFSERGLRGKADGEAIGRPTARPDLNEPEYRPKGWLRLLQTLLFLLVLPYCLGVIAFGMAWGVIGERLWVVALLVNFVPFYFLPAFVLLPLALILRARRAALLLIPLMVAALILYSGYFIPRTTAPPDPAWSLRIIALNVSDSRHPMERIEAWLREQSADVVILSEIPRPLEATAPRMADMYPFFAAQNRLNAVAVLSRYPIIAEEGFIYRETGYSHFPRVTLLVGDQEISLIATSLAAPFRVQGRIPLPDVRSHLINGAWDMLWGYDDDTRETEISQIIQWVDASTIPVIIAGDMNLVERSSDYQRLSSRLVDSYRDAATGFGFTYPALEAFGLPSGLPALMRIDYVWHTRDLVTLDANYGEYVGSDHLPVMATIGGY